MAGQRNFQQREGSLGESKDAFKRQPMLWSVSPPYLTHVTR